MKLCECGCGEKVSIAKRSNRTFGHIKGEPVRFIPGHHRRGAYPPLEERFRARVSVSGPDDCWEWTAGRLPAGYGAVWDNSINRHRHAHRLAWELEYGPIPDGIYVCHTCDNPPCCNPAHLFLGTHADNDMDRTAKGRSSRGSQHPDAKLNETSVREIRRRVADGESQADLANEFGISTSSLHAAAAHKTWKHVT